MLGVPNLSNKPIGGDYNIRHQSGQWFVTKLSGPVNREQSLQTTKILQQFFFQSGNLNKETFRQVSLVIYELAGQNGITVNLHALAIIHRSTRQIEQLERALMPHPEWPIGPLTSIQKTKDLCSELTHNAPKGAVGVDPNAECFIRHCGKVAELLFVYTQKIQTHFPNFRVDPLEMLMAGYLHDIGRIVAKDDREQACHAIVGSKYLQGLGLERIAMITYAHSLCPEKLSFEEFDGITYEQALPKYWQQILVTYVDCCVDGNGNFVGLTNRLRELKSRYHSAAMDAVVDKTMPRLKIIKRIVTSLINGSYAGNFSEWRFL
jgi:hypothetical protein